MDLMLFLYKKEKKLVINYY